MSVCVLQVGLMASPLRFDGRVVLVTGAGGGEHAKAGGHALPGVAAWEQLPSGLSMGLRAAGGVGKQRPGERRGERGAGRGRMRGEDVQLLLSGHRVCCGGRGGAGGRAWGATDSYPRGQLQPLPRPALCSRPWAPELREEGGGAGLRAAELGESPN